MKTAFDKNSRLRLNKIKTESSVKLHSEPTSNTLPYSKSSSRTKIKTNQSKNLSELEIRLLLKEE